jgi:NitT/TauT family transport system ATP-binding protein/nitrate/nitrite transport system substrate-binding protein
MTTDIDQTGEAAPIRIGLLRLTDAAPIVVAQEKGIFAGNGLDVRLSVEPSWANIADKLTFGFLDAAVMLPPLAFAVSLGLRGAAARLIVPMSLSLNGNSVTVSTEVADALAPALGAGPMAVGLRLRDTLRSRSTRLKFAVVHVYSTHNLLLRYWLASCGIDPDEDIDIGVVPPAEAAAALGTGRIDGFCAGAPWGEVAAKAGIGRTIVRSSEIWGGHPEKCLAVTEDWAAGNPDTLNALLDAVLAAARFCDAPAHAGEIARLLATDSYLALDPSVIEPSLPSAGGIAEAPSEVDRSVFFASAANFPWRSQAAWFLGQMARWGQLSPEIDIAAAASIYRPDLFRDAAARAGIAAPTRDSKIEGGHGAPWMLQGAPADIAMAPDRFCDGLAFEP